MGKRVPIPDRLWHKVRLRGDGCWEFTGMKDTKGYGVIWMGRKTEKRSSSSTTRAHRLAYELTFGEIPDGIHIHHLCGNRACVNPEHLEAIDQSTHNLLHQTHENGASVHRAKTHCKHGHPFDDENTYISRKGQRVCRECQRRASREWHRKHASRR